MQCSLVQVCRYFGRFFATALSVETQVKQETRNEVLLGKCQKIVIYIQEIHLSMFQILQFYILQTLYFVPAELIVLYPENPIFLSCRTYNFADAITFNLCNLQGCILQILYFYPVELVVLNLAVPIFLSCRTYCFESCRPFIFTLQNLQLYTLHTLYFISYRTYNFVS